MFGQIHVMASQKDVISFRWDSQKRISGSKDGTEPEPLWKDVCSNRSGERGCTVHGPWHGIVFHLSQPLTIKGSWIFLFWICWKQMQLLLYLLIKNLHFHWTNVTLTKIIRCLLQKNIIHALKKKKAVLSLKSTAACQVLLSAWHRCRVVKVLYLAFLKLQQEREMKGW